MNQNQVRLIADYGMGDKSTLGFTVEFNNNDYPDSEFGLLHGREWAAGVDYTYALTKASNLNAFYEHSRMDSDQRGRQSGAAPSTNPADNWTVNLIDNFDTVGLGYETSLLGPNSNWHTTLTYSHANGDANLDSPPGGTPNVAVSIANVDETEWITFRTGIDFRLLPRTKLGMLYWFEHYTIDDFAENSIRANAIIPAGTILLNASKPDYTYHAGWLGFIFEWGS